MSQIYLDAAATMPMRAEVRQRMADILAANHGNPGAAHGAGREAARLLAAAREQLAGALGATPAELIFTSGATESNNLALIGAARFYQARGRHLVTARSEHKSVIDTVRHLQSLGWKVTWLVPERDGRVDPARVAEAIRDDTVLVSLMAVNNETGAINDIESISRHTRERAVLLHVDAAQAVGRIPLDLGACEIDLLSVSAHKLGGPAGVGALYLRAQPRARVQPLFHGGGQERGLRPGTVPLHQADALAHAVALAVSEREPEQARCRELREALWTALSSALDDIHRNGEPASCVGNILSVSFGGVDGEALIADLPELAIARGSACTSGGQEPSYVLRALGRDDALADSALRFSFHPGTTREEVMRAADLVVTSVRRLRALAPDADGITQASAA